MRSGRRESSKQQANLFIMPIARSVAPSSNAPASEVTGPASNAATTLRPSTGANSKKFGVQSVGIGVLRESEINCCCTTIFADSQPRCTQFGERSALALRGRAPPSNRLEGERWHSRARGVPGLGQQAARVPDAPADTELGRCRDRQVGGAADRERRRVDHAIRAQQGGSDPPQHGMHLRVAALSRVDRMASYLYFLGVAANVRRPPLSGGSREPALGK